MPTDGPARATRGPTPVNNPFIPPSLFHGKFWDHEDQLKLIFLKAKHQYSLTSHFDNLKYKMKTKVCYPPPDFHQCLPCSHL